MVETFVGYSELCSCDRCDIDPAYHLPSHLCAGHYDRLMNPHKSR